jgi:hypothetical protein
MKRIALVLLAVSAVGTLLFASTASATHPRFAGGAVLRVPLTIAYQECTTANSNYVHGAALNFPSCNPHRQNSTWLTTGGGVSGYPSQGTGYVKLTTCPSGTTAGGGCSTPSGMSSPDVRIELSMSDIRCLVGSAGQGGCEGGQYSDYVAGVQLVLRLRITDHYNRPSGGAGTYTSTATAWDFHFPVTAGCVANPAGANALAIGSTCSVLTHFNALIPGAIHPTTRGNYEFVNGITVYDGAQDGIPGHPNATLFAREGLVVP